MKLYAYTYIIIKMEKIQERTMFILNEIVVRATDIHVHVLTVTTLVQKFAIVAKLCFF